MADSNPQEIIEKLKQAGVDPNALFALAEPLIENAANKIISGMNLPKLIDLAVDRNMTPLADQVKLLNEKLGQGQGGGAVAAVAPAGGLGGILNNPQVQSQAISAVINRLMGGGAPEGGLDSMTRMAKSYGDTMKALMEPLVSMQATMRQTVLAEMNTYSKTGGILPWDREPEAPAPAKQTANLTGADDVTLVEDVVKRIRFG